MNKKTITYFGILRSITSWSKVSRELIYALIQKGVDINIFERKGFLFDSAFPIDYSIKSKISGEFKGDTVFTFEHPKTYRFLPSQTFNIGLLVYEFDVLPDVWVENINRYLDIVFVPSEFTKNSFIQSGVETHKVKVLRYGFNPKHYFPSKPSAQKKTHYTFLCIAAPHKREGIELLLDSFTKAFTSKDKVRLILKLTYMPKVPKPFEYNNLPDLLSSYINKPGSPDIEIVTNLLTEPQMGDLYRSADCYFSLTKAESFGLCFLEALACGLSVASVNYSGQTDFLSADNAHFIKHTMVPVGGEEYEKAGQPGTLALPDIDHACEIMRDLYQGKKEIIKPCDSKYQWSSIADEFINKMKLER